MVLSSVSMSEGPGFNYNHLTVITFVEQRRRFKNHPNRPCKSGEKSKSMNKGVIVHFLCAEYFYFQHRHLFSWVEPFFLCYSVLHMGRVALF